MLVLGLDTTGGDCAAAILHGEATLAETRENIGRGHVQCLGPMVRDSLIAAKLSVRDIDRIAVCSGPGSFTGLRVALAFAKGLALPHNIPVLGISGLWVRAAMADPKGEKIVMAAQDVRRGEIFWQIFNRGHPVGVPILSSMTEAKAALTKSMSLTGSAAVILGAEKAEDYIDPVTLARLGAKANNEAHPAVPLYHRPPDAKLPGGLTPPNSL